MDKHVFMTRLAQAMELRGLTDQGQIELYSGGALTQSGVSQHLSGKKMPMLDTAAEYARVLRVSLDWLAGLPQDKAELSPDASALLQTYDKLDEAGKSMARQMLGILLNRGKL